MANEIWMVRHGQSVANNGGVATTRHCDIPLTAAGEDAAHEIALNFNRTPDLIVMSSYLRTHQSAAPLIAKYPSVPTEIWPVQEFDYLDNQKCIGTTYETRRALCMEYIARNDADWRDAPGTETFNEMVARAHEFITCARMRPENFIVVFSHGNFISAVRTILAGDAPNIKKLLTQTPPLENLGIFKIINHRTR